MTQESNLLSCIIYTVKRDLTRYPNFVNDGFRVLSKDIYNCLNQISYIPFHVRDLINFAKTVYFYFTLLSKTGNNSGDTLISLVLS